MVHEEFAVEQSDAGKIIGKRGAKINEMKDKYGVVIKVKSDEPDESGKIPIHIFFGRENPDGDPSQLLACKNEYLQYLSGFTEGQGRRDEFRGGAPADPVPPRRDGFDNVSNTLGGAMNPFGDAAKSGTFGGLQTSTASCQNNTQTIYKAMGGFGRGRCLPQVTSVDTTPRTSVSFAAQTQSTVDKPKINSGFGNCNSSGFGESGVLNEAQGFGSSTYQNSFGGVATNQTQYRSGAFGNTATNHTSGFASSMFTNSGSKFTNSGSQFTNSGSQFTNSGSQFTNSGSQFTNSGSGQVFTNTRENDEYNSGSTEGSFDFAARFAMIEAKQQAKWDMKKNNYVEHPEVACLNDAQVDEIRLLMKGITAQDLKEGTVDRKIPKVNFNFKHAWQPYPELLTELSVNEFTDPTPIQGQMWPILLSGFDAIGVAQTGTGKTLAFLFPAFIHIQAQTIPKNERKGPTVLILTPTRELAQQIEGEVRKYNYKGIKSVCIYGGGNRRNQIDCVAGGVEICIATPGRLNDLISNGDLSLESISYVVLDEADRMLDMGFVVQIQSALLSIRPDRQTVMTSATWPKCVQRLALKYMNDPLLVYVETLDIKACVAITQTIIILQDEEKMDKLLEIVLAAQPTDKFIVFCARKHTVAHLVSSLVQKYSINCAAMHGDMEQCERERSLKYLKSGRIRLVVATDVAARGLDVTDITCVINYDMSKSMDEYVHRIGRTGRAGKTGVAITFICKYDWTIAPQLVDLLTKANQVVPGRLKGMAERFTEKMSNSNNNNNNNSSNRQSYRDNRTQNTMVDPLTGEIIGMRLP